MAKARRKPQRTPKISAAQQVNCANKQKYPSKQVADAVARDQMLLQNLHEVKLQSYICTVCGNWHLTSRE